MEAKYEYEMSYSYLLCALRYILQATMWEMCEQAVLKALIACKFQPGWFAKWVLLITFVPSAVQNYVCSSLLRDVLHYMTLFMQCSK